MFNAHPPLGHTPAKGDRGDAIVGKAAPEPALFVGVNRQPAFIAGPTRGPTIGEGVGRVFEAGPVVAIALDQA